MTIRGIQEAQAANNRALAAVRPRGALGRAVQWGIAEAQRYAVVVTHVDSGALRASHRTSFQERRRWARGRMMIDASSVNPHGGRPSVYGPIEHERGGSHAFYARTERERGRRILTGMAEIVRREL
jgi:hypothetical protein